MYSEYLSICYWNNLKLFNKIIKKNFYLRTVGAGALVAGVFATVGGRTVNPFGPCPNGLKGLDGPGLVWDRMPPKGLMAPVGGVWPRIPAVGRKPRNLRTQLYLLIL